MMNRETRGSDSNALDTISAAATAIASAESRAPQAFVQKKRWRSFWNVYWCFGSQKQSKKIGHAVLVPETVSSVTEVSASQNLIQSSSIVLPFAAPPSSPASFLPSEPHSAIQSPAGFMSLSSISANMYSPGPANIFAIGPYAHETQLVSPPVFSTFTTEPSTAPYTPPPESVQLTTPSSPEVPFARLLDPYPMSQYEFQNYQFQPGSPVSHLISPISGSGTSSPLKLMNLEKQYGRYWGSGTMTPDSCFHLYRQNSDIAPLPPRMVETVVLDHRVSFEVTAEDVVRCLAKESLANKAAAAAAAAGVMATLPPRTVETCGEGDDFHRGPRHRSITLGSSKEFNFDNIDDGRGSDKMMIGSDWWAADEKVSSSPGNDWSFFPIMHHPGVS
ncbi:uncharacterized protein At1g76660-like [Impatiens glandulifera]|uniref:uncharacterized protein At1g76660-like n=1 Tax=Impatiens glandulifera TaxID=253017 RepID=UPI001FB0BF4E|nr:uncharacterized protein At1g76660-like [Impatiens glandulifera]